MQKNIKYIKNQLNGLYPDSEIEGFINWIFISVLGWNRTKLMMNIDEVLDENVLAQITTIVDRLKKYEPIQYIIGETEFAGLSLLVEPNVLIPRPETEELVAMVPINDGAKVLDVCTGSGCIALGIKNRNKNARVWACDISDSALALANKNALRTGLQIEVFKCDVLKETELIAGTDFDLIISNPPYVTHSEKLQMHANVLDYEPHLALFVDDDNALIFYETIAQKAMFKLKPGGCLWFEINENKALEVKKCLIQAGYAKVEAFKDLYGKYRFAKAERPKENF